MDPKGTTGTFIYMYMFFLGPRGSYTWWPIMMADGLSRNGPTSPSNMTWPVQHGICSWVKPSLWGKHLRWTKLSRQDENTFESFAAAAMVAVKKIKSETLGISWELSSGWSTMPLFAVAAFPPASGMAPCPTTLCSSVQCMNFSVPCWKNSWKRMTILDPSWLQGEYYRDEIGDLSSPYLLADRQLCRTASFQYVWITFWRGNARYKMGTLAE